MIEGQLISAKTGQVFGDPPVISTPTPEEAREAEIARLRAARQAAYRAEADPINLQWQRGEAEKEDWLAAVEAIRARYPYPE